MKSLFTLSFFVFAFCITTIAVDAQVNETDSLALVDLYNSTNGPNWYNHSGWLTDPVKDWDGINLEGDRVIEIFLYANNLSGAIPSSIGNLSNLKFLALSSNQLSGNIPSELGNLSSLTELYLDVNQLSGSIPPELGNLSSLTNLSLNNNQLSSIPPELGNLSHLFVLGLQSNQLSGSIPPELGNLSSLRSLYLYNNQLSGSIPTGLGNLSNLSDLFLHHNQLSGNIPSELGKLTNLVSFFLDNNQLSGSIPAEIGNLTNLYILKLDHNQLSGSIPPELGNLSNPWNLSLGYNQLSGSIPPELGNLSGLNYLSLNNNQLSGAIPSFNAPIGTLDLSYNQFTFEGMEEIVQKFSFVIYYPQAKITVNINGNTLSVPAGGTLSNNVYLWVKKGQKDVIRIFGDSTFHPTESGTYAVRVKNKIATELKLTSHIIHYTAPVAANAITADKTGILNDGFSVYPNPVKDVLHVTTNGSASFSLISKSGKILFTTTIEKAGSIDVSTLAAGEYYLKNNTTNVAKKVVVVR